jgi:hypothetical protein
MLALLLLLKRPLGLHGLSCNPPRFHVERLQDCRVTPLGAGVFRADRTFCRPAAFDNQGVGERV